VHPELDPLGLALRALGYSLAGIGDEAALAERTLAEAAADEPVTDRLLDEAWRILRQKRGCRRGRLRAA
jgi:hypothetical protein